MDEFAKQRLGRITASRDFYEILQGRGERVLERKLLDLTGETTEAPPNDYMLAGKFLEEHATRLMCRRLPNDPKPQPDEPMVSPLTEWISASPDILATDYVAECKCPQTLHTQKAAAAMAVKGVAKRMWHVQVQAQMWVAERHYGYLGCYVPDLKPVLRLIFIPKDKDMHREFKETVLPLAKKLSALAADKLGIYRPGA